MFYNFVGLQYIQSIIFYNLTVTKCSNELTDSTKTELDKYKGAIYVHV